MDFGGIFEVASLENADDRRRYAGACSAEAGTRSACFEILGQGQIEIDVYNGRDLCYIDRFLMWSVTLTPKGRKLCCPQKRRNNPASEVQNQECMDAMPIFWKETSCTVDIVPQTSKGNCVLC